MFCSSCRKQPHCLPAQFAQHDDTVAKLLGQLKDCDIKAPNPRPSWLQWLQQPVQWLRSRLKRWGRWAA